MKVKSNFDHRKKMANSHLLTLFLEPEDSDAENEDEEEEDQEEDQKVESLTSFSFSNAGSANKPSIFGSTATKSEETPNTSSIFSGLKLSGSSSLFGGGNTSTPTNSSTSLFGGSANNSSTTPTLFGGLSAKTDTTSTPSIFGSAGQASGSSTSIFGSASTTGTPSATNIFGAKSDNASSSIFGGGGTVKSESQGIDLSASKDLPSFASLGANTGFSFGQKTEGFSFEGTGASVFGGKAQPGALNKSENADDNAVEDNEHDPHFEPIVPLPELVNVTTGEEEEEIIFKHRAKVYR